MTNEEVRSHNSALVDAIRHDIERMQRARNATAQLLEACQLAFKRLSELNRDDENGIRIVLANAIRAATGVKI